MGKIKSKKDKGLLHNYLLLEQQYDVSSDLAHLLAHNFTLPCFLSLFPASPLQKNMADSPLTLKEKTIFLITTSPLQPSVKFHFSSVISKNLEKVGWKMPPFFSLPTHSLNPLNLVSIHVSIETKRNTGLKLILIFFSYGEKLSIFS